MSLIPMALQQQWIMCSHPIYLSVLSELATTAYLFCVLKIDSPISRVPYLRSGRIQLFSLCTKLTQLNFLDISLITNKLKSTSTLHSLHILVISIRRNSLKRMPLLPEYPKACYLGLLPYRPGFKTLQIRKGLSHYRRVNALQQGLWMMRDNCTSVSLAKYYTQLLSLLSPKTQPCKQLSDWLTDRRER